MPVAGRHVPTNIAVAEVGQQTVRSRVVGTCAERAAEVWPRVGATHALDDACRWLDVLEESGVRKYGDPGLVGGMVADQMARVGYPRSVPGVCLDPPPLHEKGRGHRSAG